MKKKRLIFALTSFLILSPISLASCSPNSEVSKNYDEVKNYDLGNGNSYTGQMFEGKLDGEGTIKFKNKDVLTGYFIEGKLDSSKECNYKFYETGYNFTGLGTLNDDFSFSMNEGTLELNNKRKYIGKFKDNLYEDTEATFDFGTNTKYVGPFIKGSNVGLVGTIYYPPYALKGEGVWYFKGKMASLGKFENNQQGYGFIKFGDWSTYEGGIYHDTDNGWWRKGQGVQDFSKCIYNASVVGGPSSLYLYKYIGEFDYSITQWICGDGVMYYMDENGNPGGYLRGCYKALKRVGDPKGNVEILEEYKNTKEYEYDPENARRQDYENKFKGKTADVVFAGDSYMDMWQASFGLANYENDTKDIDSINTGIGGTVGSEWAILSEKLIKPFSPNKVFLHLGFNDTHMGFTVDETITSFRKISKNLADINPNIKIHFLGVEPSPAFTGYFEAETKLNEAIKKMCDESDNLIFVDTQNLFIEDGKPIGNLSSYFSSDWVHMNSKGYELWWNKLKGYL